MGSPGGSIQDQRSEHKQENKQNNKFVKLNNRNKCTVDQTRPDQTNPTKAIMSEESKESNLQQTNNVSLPRLPLSLLHLPSSSLGRTSPQTVRQNQNQEIGGATSSFIDIIDEALELIDLDDFITNDIDNSNANRTYNPKRQ